MQNIEFYLRLGASLLGMGAQAIAAAKGDPVRALELIKDRTDEIAQLERSNDKKAKDRILGTDTSDHEAT